MNSQPELKFVSTKLTKCMFGDVKCNAFGLSNNQMRSNSIINNAGWYNGNGERIGGGDLSLQDMQNIASVIDSTDIFVVLAEIDAMWDLPSTFDHAAPGKDYVIQKAVWVIGQKKNGGGAIIRARDNISKAEEATQDGVKYFRLPRTEMYASVGYTPKKIDLTGKKDTKKELVEITEKKIKDAFGKLKSSKTGKTTSPVMPPAPAGSYVGVLPNGQVGAIPSGQKTLPHIPAPPLASPPKKIKPIKKVSTKP